MKRTEGKVIASSGVILDEDCESIAIFKCTYEDGIPSMELASANAERVARAWNATLGLSNAALEAGVIGEMVKTVKDYQYLVEEDYCGVKQTIEYLRNRLGEVKALLAKLEASDNG